MDQVWGRYHLKQLIARGGMAEVYQATRRGPSQFAKQVCLKRILPDLCDDPEFVQLFQSEARIAATLSHPNIVSVEDFDIHEGQHFMAMEYVSGLDLRYILRDTYLLGFRIPIAFSIYVMEGLLAALDHAHTHHRNGELRPVVHRDVSPHNVLVSENGEVKLADFGIAKAKGLSNVTRIGIVKGKLSYMSPEEWEGSGVTPQTDIFGAGLVFFELLTGRRFFTGNSKEELHAQVKNFTVPTLSHLPSGVQRVVPKFLASKPTNRFENATAALHALHATGISACTAAEAGRLVTSLLEIRNKTQIIKQTKPLQLLNARSPKGKTHRKAKSMAAELSRSNPIKKPVAIWAAVIALCAGAILYGILGNGGLLANQSVRALDIPPVEATPANRGYQQSEPPSDSASTAPVIQYLEPILPAEPSTQTGILEINVRPWAEVQVNGVARGTTPIRKLRLKTGFHHVTLANKALKYRRSFKIQIHDGQRTIVSKRIPEGKINE